MAEPIRYNSKNIQSTRKIEIDGMLWTIKAPGAATDLRASQITKMARANETRMTMFEKKMDAGTITEKELDRYEELIEQNQNIQDEMISIFMSIYSDGTKDNASVRKWINDTPSYVIEKVFDDIRKGLKNGPEKQTSSAG